MSMLWLLPIKKIPAKIAGPALIVIGSIGLLSDPWWGCFVIAIGLAVSLYAATKKKAPVAIEQKNDKVH